MSSLHGQKNFTSIVNQSLVDLNLNVKLLDMWGQALGQLEAVVPPLQRRDFDVATLGLPAQTYGTVCVQTDAVAVGSWLGGITAVKEKSARSRARQRREFIRLKRSLRGLELYDFATYAPFVNPFQGPSMVPLSTKKRGMNRRHRVTDFIQLTDGNIGDGLPLSGQLEYYNNRGVRIATVPIVIQEGSRFDFPAHEVIGGAGNRAAVGAARFVPDAAGTGTQPYYLTTVRYFHECSNDCEDLYTAFNIPVRRPASIVMAGSVELNVETRAGRRTDTVLELTNNASTQVAAPMTLYDDRGASLGRAGVRVAPYGTAEIELSRLRPFQPDKRAKRGPRSGAVTFVPAAVTSARIIYRFNIKGELLRAFSVPPVGAQNSTQITQFSSQRGQSNVALIHNTNRFAVAVTLTVLNNTGEALLHRKFTVRPLGTVRVGLRLPRERFGTLIVQSTRGNSLVSGVVLHNIVTRADEYSLAYTAQ